ncbi:helix-turn-helix domain-containing protein [Phaeobacter sp. J2-8]|uniref:helix-turn-helix domain-containing protein n=1 Tax=Phaeobacter sp. J2-8 TaxID=2931394 RepID=UPI001FD2C549|nr:helix-turn-helix domain-containing protein [Phaeobacter sp. J2-8]MCJ7871493.1 helix-turn-helix domain-containing protein [Phaeobacter sp. J2-8]
MEQEKKSLAGQIRAGRALKGLSQKRLSELAGVSSMTVKRAEGSGKPYPSADAVTAICHALESEGVEFIPENGGGAGVRLTKANNEK